MGIFKRKNSKRLAPANVYMPHRKSSKPSNKRSKKSLFAKGKEFKRNFKFNKIKITKRFIVTFLVLFGITLIYFSTIFVTNARKNNPLEEYKETDIVGIKNVPVYPFSQFIFQNSIEKESVVNFISSGNSAYRLPENTSIEKVYKFYTEKLPEKGWAFIQSVPITSENMESGEYWFKDEKGLRIYSKFNDVWYESITKQEAESGLSERVKVRVEQDLLLVKGESQDLLPDFPWILKIPQEYIITYSASAFENMRQMQLKKIGSEEKILLVPVGKYTTQGLDKFLDKYVNLVKTDAYECGISKTIVAHTEYATAIKGSLNCTDGKHDVAVIVNPPQKVVYVLDSNIEGNPFFDTVLSNLKPQETNRY